MNLPQILTQKKNVYKSYEQILKNQEIQFSRKPLIQFRWLEIYVIKEPKEAIKKRTNSVH